MTKTLFGFFKQNIQGIFMLWLTKIGVLMVI